MRTWHYAIVFCLLISCGCPKLMAFDVAVYFDARSGVNWRSQNPYHTFCGDSTPRQTTLDRIQNEQQVFTWFDEMGVTHAIVYYPFADDFTWLNSFDIGNVKILNFSWPAEAFKYMESQRRDVLSGIPGGYVDSTTSWNLRIANSILDENIGLRMLVCDTSLADTMWRPESELGIWNGWYWREGGISGDVYMPMHFRLTCNLADTTQGNDSIATFYWLVAACGDTNDNGKPDCWWRYPGKTLMADSFITAVDSLDDFEFMVDPSPEAGNVFTLLDEDFNPTSQTDTCHRYGVLGNTPVRMCIYYHGNNHRFQVYEVDIWDEGYHRLMVDPASQDTIDDFLADAFRNQLNSAPGKMIGWYYDESQQQETINPWVRVNDILSENGLPTMYLNGHCGYDEGDSWAQHTWRHIYYQKGDSAGITIPVNMDEYYFLKDGFGCQPALWGGMPPEVLRVSYYSDTTYFYADSTNCGILPNSWMNQQQWKGSKSLQAAVDGTLYGWRPFYTIGGMGSGPNNLYACGQICMTKQAQYNHSHGSRYWAMLQGSDDDSPNDGCCPIRTPSDNEVRLSAWLAVAADCDGIIWYPVRLAGGLLEWVPSFADTCNQPGGLLAGPAYVDTTSRYLAAKDACNKIHQIASILEPLDFVKTYASRAFTVNYGDDTSAMADSLDEWGIESHHRDILWSCGEDTCILDSIVTDWWGDYPTLAWNWEPPDYRYIQISRFMMPGIADTSEDYYFLIVNRRALSNEQRRVSLYLSDVRDTSAAYFVEKLVSGTREFATKYDSSRTRIIQVELEPGEAEFVHFSRADTVNWIITQPCTLLAPQYFAKNIIVRDGGSLTILPDYDVLVDTIIQGNDTIPRWDSIATVTFWQGKGIRVEGEDVAMTLRIMGSCSTRIRLQAANTDQFWSGIEFLSDRADTLDFQYVDIQDAIGGLKIERLAPAQPADSNFFSLFRSRFHDNKMSLSATGVALIRIYYCEAIRNTYGFLFNSGVIANIHDCVIQDGAHRGIEAWEDCTLNLEQVNIWSNGSGGILSYNSDLRMKCCRVENNVGTGVDIIGGSVLMADPDHPTDPNWGGNKITVNTGTEIRVENILDDWSFARGRNQVFDDCVYEDPVPDAEKWIVWLSTNLIPDGTYRGNYWGTEDTATIRRHLDPVVSVTPLWWDSTFCQFTPLLQDTSDEGWDAACLAQAAADELNESFADAKDSYKGIVEDDSTDCGRKPSTARLLAVDFLGNFDNDSTREYLKNVADTTTDADLRQGAKLSIAFSWIKSGEPDSAWNIYQTMIDSAGDNIYKEIAGEVGLMNLGLLEQMTDTTGDGLTTEELEAYLDTLDLLLSKRFEWSQYVIEDSVVMYAPCIVDSQIQVIQGGILTILPYPGTHNPVVNFGSNGSVYLNAANSYYPRSKLYVLGEENNRVTLRWGTGATGTISSLCGHIEMKHALLEGSGLSAFSDRGGGYRPPIFRVDSCEFRLFGEGVWLLQTDTLNDLRNSLLVEMGNDPNQMLMDFNTSLSAIDGAYLDVSNCIINNGGDVGIFYGFNSSEMNIESSTITESASYGVLAWEGSDLSLECCDLSSNGDTLPELWVTDGLVDLVGSHTELTDSFGTLAYSSDPSYLDLEEGESGFTLWSGNGLYLKSGDTTDIWDITLNTWSPAMPTDSNFYDFLYPHNPAKWTADSSLADFIACGTGGAASMGHSPFVVVGDNDGHTLSIGDDNETAKSGGSQGSRKGDYAAARQSSPRSDDIAARKNMTTRQQMRMRHEAERSEWRRVKDGLKSSSPEMTAEATKQFITNHPGSEFIPAALVKLSHLADKANASTRISEFLQQQAKFTTDPSTRTLAQRLSFVAMAKEGDVREGLAGLEEMIENAATPQDSIKALVSAMGVYFLNNPGHKIEPRLQQVRCNDVKHLTARVIQLAHVLDGQSLGSDKSRSEVPKDYCLYQNYPNPFNPTTEIRFDLPEAVRVELKVFNILGQEVTTLVDQVRLAGAYRVLWDSRTASGTSVASGVYVYQLKAGNFTDAKKMVLIR